MSDHVLNDLADYLEGRLDPERQREFEEHLNACPECAEDVAFARDFREEAAAQGLRHLSPERIVELVDGGDRLQTDGERRHLGSCLACRREIEWARSLPGEGSELLEETPRTLRVRSGSRRRYVWGAAVLAAAAAIFFFVKPRDTDRSLRDLAQVEPLPVRVSRGPVDPGSFEESRVRGLELYAAGDYEAARAALRSAAAMEPQHAEVALYLGSVELLLGEESATQLRAAADLAEDSVIRGEALWQLANAHLVSGDAKQADQALREAISLDGRRRADAEALLKRLMDRE